MAHLGSRVSALLDGQLSPADAERAWAHVHQCHACRDLVEHEGWVKTSLATLAAGGATGAPDHLKGSLLGTPPLGSSPALGEQSPEVSAARRHAGLVAMGGGAVGAAFLGVVALGIAPYDAPTDRRAPVTNIGQQPQTPSPVRDWTSGGR